MKEPVKYSQAELERPSKFIVVVADENVDTSIVDIEEARGYVELYKRRAIIISGKEVFKNSDIEKLSYLNIRNATNPAIKIIDHGGQSYKKVYETVMNKYQNGLVIAHPETLTHEIADSLAKNFGNGLDFIIYRRNLMEVSMPEKTRINFIRFHYNPDFSFSKEMYRNFSEQYGEGGTIGIFVSQYIANYQYALCESYFNETSEIFESQGCEDYVNYNELNKAFAYHVYFDVKRQKIIGFTPEKLVFYLEMVFKAIENKPLFNKAEYYSKIFAL